MSRVESASVCSDPKSPGGSSVRSAIIICTGIRLPEIQVPLATYAGWNLFNEKAGPADELSSMQGSYIPFPRTKADRERTGDPRRSVEERYQNRDQYLSLITAAAARLIEQGYLLKQDLPAVLKQAGDRWDFVNK